MTKFFILLCVAFAAVTGARADILQRPVPDRWIYVSPYAAANDEADSLWWRAFNDPVLNSLVDAGRAANYDVAAALRRIDAARAQIGTARAAWYPTVSASAGYAVNREQGITVDRFSAGATASWEIDVFGRVRDAVSQSKAQYRATRAEAAGTLVAVTAEIATAYINYRMTQACLQVARDHCASQQHLVTIAQARHEAGLASALDVAQAENVYFTTLSTIEPLEAQLHSLRNSLATLLGVYADSLPPALISPAPLPACPSVAAAGVPADLLRRRPDIMAAEQQIAAAAAGVGIARKEFMPVLSLRGSIGFDTDNRFKGGNVTYSIEPTLTWTVFSGFSRKFALAEARAQMQALIESYNATVVSAVAEADSQLAAFGHAIANIDNLQKATDQSHKMLTLSVDLYKSGESGFTNVADAQISYLSNTNSLISARATALLDLIGLYKALGGAGGPILQQP